MSSLPLTNKELASFDSQQRFQYFLEQAVAEAQVWILTDEEGFVLLNCEEESCIPVWPSEESALLWAVAGWENCQPKAIALKTWQLRWTQGLTEDQLLIVVFPSIEEEGLVLEPEELDAEFRRQIKKNNTKKK
ncbi:MAG: DUF2750 domain-containing protein [Oceanospirillaceae bacterium]